jgi:hypothetical protein
MPTTRGDRQTFYPPPRSATSLQSFFNSFPDYQVGVAAVAVAAEAFLEEQQPEQSAPVAFLASAHRLASPEQ